LDGIADLQIVFDRLHDTTDAAISLDDLNMASAIAGDGAFALPLRWG